MTLGFRSCPPAYVAWRAGATSLYARVNFISQPGTKSLPSGPVPGFRFRYVGETSQISYQFCVNKLPNLTWKYTKSFDRI